MNTISLIIFLLLNLTLFVKVKPLSIKVNSIEIFNNSILNFGFKFDFASTQMSIEYLSLRLWHVESNFNLRIPWFQEVKMFDYSSPYDSILGIQTFHDCLNIATNRTENGPKYRFFVWRKNYCILFENQDLRLLTECQYGDFCGNLIVTYVPTVSHLIQYSLGADLSEYDIYKFCPTVNKNKNCVDLFHSISYQIYNKTENKYIFIIYQEQKMCYPIKCLNVNASIEQISKNMVMIEWKNTIDVYKYKMLLSINGSEYIELPVFNNFTMVQEKYYDSINIVDAKINKMSLVKTIETCSKICSDDDYCHRFVIINNTCYKTLYYDPQNRINCDSDPICYESVSLTSNINNFKYTVTYNTDYKFLLVGTYGNGFKAYSNEISFSTYSKKFIGTCRHNIEYENDQTQTCSSEKILLISVIILAILFIGVVCFLFINCIRKREQHESTGTINNHIEINQLEVNRDNYESNIYCNTSGENDYETITKRASEHKYANFVSATK